jgi:hypothetical protein
VATSRKFPVHTHTNLHGRNLAGGLRALAVSIALASVFGIAGCMGLTGTPSAGGSSGGGGTQLGGPASAQLSASSTSVSFGNVTVGTSTAQLVTLTATGNANVSISSVSPTGSGFSASGGSNVILTPNQSVTVSVNFGPTAAGGVTGKLSVSSNASNSLVQIGLSGTGIASAVAHSVTLSWQPSASQVIGYFVYRGTPSGGNLLRLNAPADASTSYTDSSVAGGRSYVYAVRSVDASNVESADSNQVSVTIPSP